MKLDKNLFNSLFEQAKVNPRLRQPFDLRTSAKDGSQRMLNALLPGTEVAVHKHPNSSENIVCLCGRMDVILVELLQADEQTQKVIEKERVHLCPFEGNHGCVVPAGTWHTVEVLEPSVIYKGKDGRYGEDGSIMINTSAVSNFGVIR